MSGQTPNSSNINRVAAGVANSTSIVVHPEYEYWRPEWRKLRDVLAGQREIKRQGQLYLRSMPKQDDDDYELYLERATFYNMTGQTLNAMLGQVFRRDPILVNIAEKYKNALRLKFAKDGAGHVNFVKTVISEQIGMGRFGVLVDAPETPSTTPTSFVVGYATENILDWEIADINGTYQLTRVLLREFKRQSNNGPTPQNPWIGARNPNNASVRAKGNISTKAGRGQTVRPVAGYIEAYTYTTIYRELSLEQLDDGSYRYVVYVYDEDPTGEPTRTMIPMMRGKPLDFIPFCFFGATSNTPDVEKSPLLDIADLNLSHYRSYAELEWGRMYTALPVYYAPGNDGDSAAEYHIGPSMVWEVPDGQTPGILEYKGEGLKAIERALDDKERQIAAIGGRLMPGSKNAGSEAPGQTAMRESAEQTLLLNVIQSAESGMIQVVRWWLMWRDVPLADSESFEYRISRDFLSQVIDARTIRAIQMLHEDGVVPIDVLHGILIKTEFLDAEVTVEQFKDMLTDPNSFPNNPDVAARQRGFSSRQQELEQTNIAREADLQQQEIDLEERQVVLEENAPPPVITAPGAPKPSGANPSRPMGPKPKRPKAK